MRSPGKRQRRRADDVGRGLALELLRAADDAEIDAKGVGREDRESGLEIADQRLLANVAAGAKRVAVEKEVLADAQKAAGLAIGEDVADAGTGLRDDVDAIDAAEQGEAPMALIG